METYDRRWDTLAIAAIVVVAVVTLFLYPRLPDPMPTHWNAAGQVDGTSPRTVGAWMLPGLMVGLYGLLLLLPRIDPRRENIARFADTYALLRVGTILFMGYVHFATLYAVLSGRDDMVARLIGGGVGLLFILIGNYLPRVRSNWFMGIRTPWTLSSEQVWRKTHFLAGRLFVLGGVLLCLMPFLPASWMVPLVLFITTVVAAIPIAYSFWLYQREARQEA